MATLTQGQIYTIALTAGLENPKLMAAIAMAESSGRTDVVNSIGCVGLWQINQPVHAKAHPTWTVAWLKNPVNNALAAKVIYKSQGLAAWEAYTNGAYKKYAGGDVPGEPVDGGGGASTQGSFVSDVPLIGDALDAGEAVVKAGAWIANPDNWARVLYVVAGGALVIAGLALTVRVPQAVSSVVPAAKIMKKVT